MTHFIADGDAYESNVMIGLDPVIHAMTLRKLFKLDTLRNVVDGRIKSGQDKCS